MGTMPPKDILTLWARDRMSVEMAVGHILQNLAKLQATVEANHRKIHQLQFTLESSKADWPTNLTLERKLTQQTQIGSISRADQHESAS